MLDFALPTVAIIIIFCIYGWINSGRTDGIIPENVLGVMVIISIIYIIRGFYSFIKACIYIVKLKAEPEEINTSIPRKKIKLSKQTTMYALAVLFILLMLLNPSTSQFRDYIGEKDVTKKMNFLIVSVYEYNGNKYLGFLMNFIPL